MIGCLLFYALYPLSRYLLRRPWAVNGMLVCESAAATSPMFKSPKIPPGQQLSQSNLSTGQKEKKESVQLSGKEDKSSDKENKTPDGKRELPVSSKHTKMEAPSNMSEARYAVTGNDSKGEEDKKEEEEEEVGQMHYGLKQPNCEETVAKDNDLRVICFMGALARMESSEDSGNAAVGIEQQTEYWDEYADVMLTGGTNSTPMQTSLLSCPENQCKTPSGWHFPAGPGGREEIFCPRWQFPTLSYYPSLEQTTPFEVIWRLWQDISSEQSGTAVPFTKPFMDLTVMSYNILAQDLLETNMELYAHCSPEVLEWSNRCSLLLEDIQKWMPDILCLQEVQENHYQTQLHPFLTQMGYNCVYKRRTGNKTDGCATCYRSSCFSEVSVTPIEFFRPQTELLDRHNVGIVVVLQPVVCQGSKDRMKGSLLCVANTHLLFNPRRGDIKLAQLAIMLAEINSVVNLWKAKGEHCNVVLCGDFNSVPHMPLYQFITTGELDFQGVPAWMVSGQKDLSHKAPCDILCAPLWPACLGISDSCQYVSSSEVDASHSPVTGRRRYSLDSLLELRFCPLSCVRPCGLPLIPGVTDNNPGASSRNHSAFRFQHIIRHQLDLESTYKHRFPHSGHPEVTTLHSEGGSTVDYIFYSPEHISDQAGKFGCEGLKLLGYLSLLSEETLCSMNGLPNYIFPSDHLSLVAKFRMTLNVPAC
ncbi:protein angel homolog 1 isoform X2 [Hippocampus comes]|uniref:protein angel homolog 1 isoform X2 n=1 Tax=Hippocampus comes TaxID=109280 RepID=UPI00094E77CA|nr:PREDICTED: protein angel homolog 1-like isoform X2 [Hippocampus comes]